MLAIKHPKLPHVKLDTYLPEKKPVEGNLISTGHYVCPLLFLPAFNNPGYIPLFATLEKLIFHHLNNHMDLTI